MTPGEQMAKRLKTLRRRRGLTQEALAAKAGLSRTYLARLETARQDPTLSTLVKLAKALGVRVAALLEER
jgi:transcriptional regulator with XRE-family HTH domain